MAAKAAQNPRSRIPISFYPKCRIEYNTAPGPSCGLWLGHAIGMLKAVFRWMRFTDNMDWG